MFAGNVEFQMIAACRGPISLAARRAGLPRAVEDAAVNCLKRSLEPEKELQFRQALRIIYRRLLEIDLLRLRQTISASLENQTLFDELENPKAVAAMRVNRAPKFTTLAAAELAKVYDTYRSLQGDVPASDLVLARFFRDLRRNPRVFGLLEFALETTNGQHLRGCILPSRQPALFDGLNEAFALAAASGLSVQKSGRSDPVMEQLARDLASLYLQTTGEPPGRSNDAISESKQIEGGSYLKLCRTMAKAINEALPQHLRRPKAPAMVKVARRMVKELKADLNAA